MQVPFPADEADRLEAVGQYDVPGTAPEPEFDVTHLAAALVAARLAAIVENSDDAIISKTLDGIILTWNAGAQKLYGYTAQEAIGRPVSFLAPADLPDEMPQLLEKIRRGEPVEHFETVRVRKDGSRCAISLSISPLKDEQGNIIGASSIKRDITERKRAAEAEQEALRFLQSTLDTLISHIAVLDGKGTIIAINKAWRQFAEENQGTGTTCGVGANYLAVCDQASGPWAEQAPAVAQGIREVIAGQQQVFCLEYPCHSCGEERWFNVCGTRFVGEGPVRVVVAYENVTECKRAAADQAQLVAQVEQQRQRLNTIVTNVPGMVWEAWGAPDDAGQRIDFVSDYVTTMVGYSVEEWTATPNCWLSIVHPDDQERAAREAAAIFASGQSGAMQFRWMAKDGRVVWTETQMVVTCDEAGCPLGMRGVSLDITERKQAEEALRTSEERFRLLVDSVQDYGIIMLDAKGRVASWNAGAERIKGYRSEEIIGEHFSRFCTEEDLQSGKPEREIETATREGRYEEEAWRVRKDGSRFWANVLITPVCNANGQLVGFAKVTRDITERKQAQEALQEAHVVLESRVEQRTSQLATANVELQTAREQADAANLAKSEFLSRMSHELRTPLNAILGFGQILNKQDLTPLAKESVGYILKGGRHLLDLINEVLDIARVEAGHINLSLEAIGLADIVPEACALVRPLAAERNIRLVENTSELGTSYILADLQRLKQVLINLLSNAIKYNREGGQVEVSCDPKPDGWTSIAIRDTGPGISPRDLPKLFTPFERLDASNSAIEGTGLGLVLSQRLVAAMGGTLSVESALGQGTTFTLALPQATPPEEQLANWPEGTPHAHSGEEAEQTYSVLCIEDNPANLRLLEVIFEGRPEITLLAAIQGSVGLDLARQHEPDLILLDLDLPDIKGHEVLTRLQQSAITRDIPVVVVSADATPNQINRLLTAGASAYLTKPLDVDQFIHTVDRFLQTTPAIATR